MMRNIGFFLGFRRGEAAYIQSPAGNSSVREAGPWGGEDLRQLHWNIRVADDSRLKKYNTLSMLLGCLVSPVERQGGLIDSCSSLWAYLSEGHFPGSYPRARRNFCLQGGI